MKLLNYIYTLLIAVLLGFFSFACSDDDVEQTEGKESADVYGGEPITTTVKVCISAPDVSVDIESATRADNANIEYAQPENGGRFQNIVVVVTDNSDNVYAIHCNKWYDGAPTSTGVKQYEVIFPDLKINATTGKVYALGNVSTDVYNTISGYTVSGATAMSNYTEINNLIKTSNISVTTANLYNLSFKPQAGNFKVGSTDVTTACSGMPVNAVATATVKKGATVFDVKMRRVCARLQVTFRNFTGQYIDYNDNTPQDNNVYVDQFEITNILNTSSKYFNGTSSGTVAKFDILKALGGTNDHVINKIENGKDVTISMYVFENTGTYKYNLKVDRGKSLGLNTTTIDPENAYVIWNNSSNVTNPSSISYRNGKIQVSNKQTSYELIPFSDQVFWQLVEAPKPHVDNVYALKHFQIDINTDRHVESNIYLTRVTDSYIDWGFFGTFYSYKHINSSPATQLSKAQYIQFRQKDKTANEFTMNLLNADNVNIDYWDRVGFIVYTYRHVMLTLCDNDHDSNVENQLSTQRSDFWNGNQLGNYDWTLYAKYIIKKDQTLRDITQIDRNHSYELEFKVMPNYETKQDLIVNCVRRQNEVDWSETQK
ncbi:MAG: hypothetical protein UH850_04645 [Paludibacteraceae bacterium]|nr:hypothetical protein [Paludibacteraceae bacterium]